MAPKIRGDRPVEISGGKKVSQESHFLAPFSESRIFDTFWSPFLEPFATLLLPFGSLLGPAGSLLDRFGSLLASIWFALDDFWLPLAPLLLIFMQILQTIMFLVKNLDFCILFCTSLSFRIPPVLFQPFCLHVLAESIF